MARESFAQVVALAIADIAEHGFDSEARIQAWMQRIRQAMHLSMGSATSVDDMLRRSLTAKFNAALTGSRKYHRGLDRFTLARVAPAARAELDRRIVASVQLIKLNREEAMQKTIRRFVGWSTSVPAGGGDVAKREEAKEVKKALGSLGFLERRVAIDQGHKMVANVNEVIAKQSNAIAVEWNHVMQTAGYDPRPEHVAMNGNIYLLRNTWATDKGLVKPGKWGWYDETDGFAVLPYCRCYGTWRYRLSGLPDDMITVAGREVIEASRRVSA